jgi:hypothetical protein
VNSILASGRLDLPGSMHEGALCEPTSLEIRCVCGAELEAITPLELAIASISVEELRGYAH